MKAKSEYRNREETEVAVLDALVGRPDEGMTVFELRSQADVSIDDLEDALAELKADDLIEVTDDGGRTVIVPAEDVVGGDESDRDRSVFDALRDRLPF